jgi:hypothetical protein
MKIILHRKNKGYPSNIFIATNMRVNMEKSSLYSWGLSDQENQHISYVLYLQVKDIDASMKYIGFSLTGNNYNKKDYL